MSEIRFVKLDTTPLFRAATGKDERFELLWGDRVEVLSRSTARAKVRARGMEGFVRKNAIGPGSKHSLLEFYFIDVGQGDGVLIRTPDDRHILVDGGWPRRSQPTGKNAADFVDWKFERDYGRTNIELDAVVCSHNDQDHYGGLWDLMNRTAAVRAELNCEDVLVEEIYHAGLSWWKTSGGRTLGPSKDTAKGEMFTRLLDDRASVEAGLASGASPALQGEWAKFWRQAKATKNRAGGETPIKRLSDRTEFLPGFDGNGGGAAVHVLGPVEFAVDGSPAIRKIGSADGQNTNGNSVLLRVDYGKARVLLTGDLNQKSQELLLKDYKGRTEAFECDVAKGCHHGSDDVGLKFLDTVEPSVTIISSGDSEGHDHPRPQVVAASGRTGLESVHNDRLETPLVFITELARSVALGTPTKMEFTRGGETHTFTGDELKDVKVTYK
ncbi:MAG: ComEC/Rec2 family competence protein, partial [Ilumatobacteraceae bacterium]